jgi:uncharacterized protein YndB with AHSA1/START domain
MAKIIKHELFYPQSPEVVWEYLTNPELVAQWLMPGNFQPILGHEFQLTTKPKAELDFDGIFHCKILEVTPFTKLSYSWKFGPGDGTLNDSVVDWTLSEKDNGTELQIIHRGIGNTATSPLFALLDAGWLEKLHKIFGKINETANGTTPA